MITKQDIVASILPKSSATEKQSVESFAPSNIALCKYWGKRDKELNLPVTSSLSLSLGSMGSKCNLSLGENQHEISLNDEQLPADSPFAIRAIQYLELFRNCTGCYYQIKATNTIPTAAGFASSASGFASLVLALNQLHGWKLPERDLSILARIGSGSACRSFWNGFVEWHAGQETDGSDSYAEPLNEDWPDLHLGILVLKAERKPISSREAMQRTVETSALYRAWPGKVATDMRTLRCAITEQDIDLLGATAESNALAMHASMMAALPPVLYWLPESITTMHRVWQTRAKGIPVYFTMDAGPNIKLLFLDKDEAAIRNNFPDLQIAR